jgi:hypothetical protein
MAYLHDRGHFATDAAGKFSRIMVAEISDGSRVMITAHRWEA